MNVQDAKAHLSELVARAERGEIVIIGRAGSPGARLVALAPTPPRTFGSMEFTTPDTFDEPLPDADLRVWE